MLSTIWSNRNLVRQLLVREIQSRYRGSVLGLAWSFVTPLLMLSVYTLVFQYVFKARWNVGGGEPELNFAMMLFSGLILHGLLGEVLTRSPRLIVNNVNFVKKVVFPLEILSCVTLLSALFHFFIGFLLLLGFILIELHAIPLTALLLPVVLLPYFLLLLGFSWILAALGVYVRDIEHVMGTLVTLLLFTSPIFFSTDRLPQQIRNFMFLNPISLIVESSRKVLVHGQLPDFQALLIYGLVALLIMLMGYLFFQKSRSGFSDVL